MMKIVVRKPDNEELEKREVYSWPIWEKEISQFDWYYDSMEECFLLEGQVTVETEDGNKIILGKGDFVTFPRGLSCVWKVTSPVRKHFNLT